MGAGHWMNALSPGRCGRQTERGQCGDRSLNGLPVWCGICAAGSEEREKRRAGENAEEQLAQLLERRRVYIEYARHRIDDEDWHGCSDAANDLRELDAEIRMHRSHHDL